MASCHLPRPTVLGLSEGVRIPSGLVRFEGRTPSADIGIGVDIDLDIAEPETEDEEPVALMCGG
jgi:hypothetical protein